jgi:hypothetical protein
MSSVKIHGRMVLFLLLFSPGLLFSSNVYAEIKSDVAFGSHFKIRKADADVAVFNAKPSIYLSGGLATGSLASKFQKIKVLTKTYPADEIECLFDLEVPSDTYELYVGTTRGSEKKLLTRDFYVMNPVLESMSPQWGKPGETITLQGKYFGTIFPKMQMEYFDTVKKKLVLLKCPVVPAKHFMDPDTGISSLQFKIPEKMPDSASIIILACRTQQDGLLRFPLQEAG